MTSTAYNGFGQAATVNFGSLDSDSFTYDAKTGRMNQYKFNVNGSPMVGNLTWNANGALQQLQLTDPFNASDTQTCNNTYDDLSRLVSNNCGSIWSQAFSYDAFGNIAMTGTSSFLPTYNLATNRYRTLPAGTPSYDPNGNVTNDAFHLYSWDAEGRNTKVDASGPLITYDALGRWVDQYSSVYSRQAVYTPAGEKLALMQGASLVTAYLPLSGGAVARYTSSGLGYYLHADWLGSTRLLSSASRVAAAEIAVSPFGKEYIGNLADSFFTGVAHVSEEASDLWTFPARNYAENQGRWIGPDPAGLAAVDLTNPQSWNRYGYVNNNPLANVDPTGMFLGRGSGWGGDGGGFSIGGGFCSDDFLGLIQPEHFSGPGQFGCHPGLTYFQDPGSGGGGGGGGGGGTSSPPVKIASPVPAKNGTCPAPITGFGVGLLAGASAEAGVGKAGASLQGSVGAGAFVNGSFRPSLGAYAAGAALANAGREVVGAPQQMGRPSIYGAYAGYGPGIFITNAGSAQQLAGPFWTMTINIGIGIGKASISLGSSNGVIIATVWRSGSNLGRPWNFFLYGYDHYCSCRHVQVPLGVRGSR